MAKKFYTEKDIEELVSNGVKSLKLNDNILLTELAYEKAKRLGLQLLDDQPDNPPSAPVRPYLSGQTLHASPSTSLRTGPKTDSVVSAASHPKPDQPKISALEQRIRAAVIAKMGNQIDAQLLDLVIARVLKSTGMK